jgi:hypothetical protein
MSTKKRPPVAGPHLARIDPTARAVRADKKIRKDAEKIREEAEKVRLGAVSALAPEDGHEPNVLIRAAAFRAANGTSRRWYPEYFRLSSVRNINISFKGTELLIFDLYVWMKLARLVRSLADKLPDGKLMYKPVSFTMRSLCTCLGLVPNPATRERVQNSLAALWSAEFQITEYSHNGTTEEIVTRQFRLLASRVDTSVTTASSDGTKRSWKTITLNLDGNVLELFKPGHYSKLDLITLKKLMKTPLAAWLYAHLATHDNFSKGMLYETLRELAALDDRPPRKVRGDVVNALSVLEKLGLISDVRRKPDKFELVSHVRSVLEVTTDASDVAPSSEDATKSNIEDSVEAKPADSNGGTDAFVNWLNSAPSRATAYQRLSRLKVAEALTPAESSKLEGLIEESCFD